MKKYKLAKVEVILLDKGRDVPVEFDTKLHNPE